MLIKSLNLKGYHLCKNTNVELCDTLTSLIGINGSGKTTILKGLFLLKQALRPRNSFRYKNTKEYSTIQLNISFYHEKKQIDLKTELYYIVDQDLDEEIIFSSSKWRIEGLAKGKWLDIPLDALANENQLSLFEHNVKKIQINELTKSWYSYKTIKDVIPQSVFEIVFSVVNFINGFSYYSATKFSEPTKCSSSIELDDNSYLRRTRQYPHDSFIMDLYRLKNEKDIDFQRFMNLINNYGIGLIKDIRFQQIPISYDVVNVKADGKIATDKRDKLIIVPQFLINSNWISPSQLSEGTFKSIALLFYLISSKSTFIMIEEPEICIHHGLLNSLIEVIQNESKRKQIIISTHSDYVLDCLMPENVVIISNIVEKGIIAKKMSHSLSKNGYKALHQYLNEVGNLGEYWKEGGLDNDFNQ